MFIVKRSGKRERFDRGKIVLALNKANESVPDDEKISKTIINNIVEKVERVAEEKDRMLTVDDIQDTIEKYLIAINKYTLAKSYIKHRYTKELARDKYLFLLSI